MQNRRAIMFLILAVALGVGAAFTAQRWLEQQRQQYTGHRAHIRHRQVNLTEQQTSARMGGTGAVGGSSTMLGVCE